MGGLLSVLRIATLMMAVLWLSGCAAPSYKKADDASVSLRRAAMAINTENRAIDSTMAALDDLVDKPGADLRPQFQRFDGSLDWLIGSAKEASKSADLANKKCAEYFQSWDRDVATINYAAVRDQSVSRKAQVSDELKTVDQRYRENQAVVEPLISYMQDIRTSLSTDLTAGGLEAVKPLVENARQNAGKVQSALAQLSTDLAASGTRISSVNQQEVQLKAAVSETTQKTQQRAESATQSSVQ